jgi:tRNA nucleotidyltransferase/poly(A) polymerase
VATVVHRRLPPAPPAVRWLAGTLEDAGYETWAVGGVVRDVLMDRPSGDWDFATRATPKQVRKLFRRTVPIGVEHGTVGVLARDGTMYEVTTFRRDVETDGRHAVVSFADTIEEDLGRRDFTINAVAWHPLREELFDPFGGVDDLEAGILRTVGAPEERFREDYLRILRALRFAGLFRLDIEKSTWTAMCDLVEHLSALSAERVREELLKVLGADPSPGHALDLYARSGALGVLYPELEALRSGPSAVPGVDRWLLSVATVGQLPPGRPLLRLAALLKELDSPAAAGLLLRLRLSNAQVDETAFRVGAAPLPDSDGNDREFRRWLSASGPGRLAALARLDLARAKAERMFGANDRTAHVVASWRRAREVRAAAPPLSVGDLALDGRGLIALGLKPGPGFGRILDALLDWVLDDPERNRRGLLEARAVELARHEVVDG